MSGLRALRPFRTTNVLAGLLLLAACGDPPPAEVRVHAASSLVDVMERIGREYEAATGVKVRLNFAASSTLARQIVEGAPGDVFLSADSLWADFVESMGRGVPGTRVDILRNEIVFVWRWPEWLSRTGAKREDLLDLKENWRDFRSMYPEGRIALGDPNHVPAGRYAREGLRKAGLWDERDARLLRTDSERMALGLFESEEVEGAFLYWSELRRRDWPNEISRLDPEDSPSVLYPALLLAPGRPDGRAFLAHLRSEEAGAIFVEAGFLLPEPPR